MLKVICKLALWVPVHRRDMHAGSHEGMILEAQHSTEKVVTPNRVGCLGMSERLTRPSLLPR